MAQMWYSKLVVPSWKILAAILLWVAWCAPTAAAAATNFLPLATGNKWVLRSSRGSQTAVIEIVSREGDGYHLRFTHPWGENEWLLVPKGDKVFMTGYGMNGQLMPLPDTTLYFDFGASAGKEWKNQLGTIRADATDTSVRSSTRSYDHCIRFKQTNQGGTFVLAFAPGVGFVDWEAGGIPFVLDEKASQIGVTDEKPAAPAVAPPSRPAPTKLPAAPRPRGSAVLIGVTPNVFANEAATPENLMKNYNRTLDLGVKYLVGNGKWSELEPTRGQYHLDSLNFQVTQAEQHHLQTSYTFRIIENIHKAVPSDLANKRWSDPEMRSRVLALVDALAPYLQRGVHWFMFGYELDGYFQRHPDEVGDFVQLYDAVAARLHQRVPGIQVSTTTMFAGVPLFGGVMKPLMDRVDFLAFTYTPLTPQITMEEPAVAHRDLQKMVQISNGRQVVLQEISYSSSPLNNGSDQKQAEFYQNAFDELRAHSDVFAAASFAAFADLSDKNARDLAAYFGLPKKEASVALLQTLGMFDVNGRPKPSWHVFEKELGR